jgi:hypothetical protein
MGMSILLYTSITANSTVRAERIAPPTVEAATSTTSWRPATCNCERIGRHAVEIPGRHLIMDTNGTKCVVTASP